MTKKLNNKFLFCINCKQEFCFTVTAQEYFAERGYKDDPKRCKTCHRIHKKSQRNNDHHLGASPPS
ncbi:MAG: zinc-ribbon domain containing protein [Candidatus Kerfeldbacteria bacterium]|jgi:putative zinc ribbon protein